MSYVPLLELCWEDILFPQVLPCLSIDDLFNLRATNKGCCDLVDSYFDQAKKLDLSSKKNISLEALKVRLTT